MRIIAREKKGILTLFRPNRKSNIIDGTYHYRQFDSKWTIEIMVEFVNKLGWMKMGTEVSMI